MAWVTSNYYGYLRICFRFQGIECEEDTDLKDRPKSRKRLQEKAQRIQYEIDHGIFDYRHHFPHSIKADSWGAATTEMGIDNTGQCMDDVGLLNPVTEKEYLSLDELVQRIPYRPQTIRNLISQGVLREKIDYFKPTQRRVVFKWSAIRRWIEGKDRDEDQAIPLSRER